jgi:hypothetical protein
MGKLTDTKLRAMKPNGKIQKESEGTSPDLIGTTLKSIPRRHRAAITDPEKVGGLLRRIRGYTGAGLSVRYCLNILPY